MTDVILCDVTAMYLNPFRMKVISKHQAVTSGHKNNPTQFPQVITPTLYKNTSSQTTICEVIMLRFNNTRILWAVMKIVIMPQGTPRTSLFSEHRNE